MALKRNKTVFISYNSHCEVLSVIFGRNWFIKSTPDHQHGREGVRQVREQGRGLHFQVGHSFSSGPMF
jgi:hypothetical protein